LPIRKFECAKFVVESAGKGPGGTLHMKAKTTIFDHQGCFEGQRFST